MLNWVANTTTIKYGKKKGTSSSFLSHAQPISINDLENSQNASKPSIFDFDSVFSAPVKLIDEEDTSIKRIKQERSAKGLKESTVEPKISAFSKPSKKKKETILKDGINSGHADDIEYLILLIDKYNAGLSAHSYLNFLVSVQSSTLSDEHKERFSKWLHLIGFKENNFRTLYYPSDELDNLFKFLKQNHAATCAAAVPPTPILAAFSKSVSNEYLPAAAEEHDSFLTAEKLEDCDRRNKGREKANISRKRSISNPLTIITTINEANLPTPSLTCIPRTRSSSSGLHLMNPSGNSSIAFKARTFPRRRSSQDSDDSSDRGESPFHDCFSPIAPGSTRSRSGSGRNRTSVSPFETSLLEKMSISSGAASTSGTTAATNTPEEEQSETTQVLYPLFSTMKEMTVGLQSISEENAADQTVDEGADGHDSETSTVLDEEEEQETPHERMSCEQFVADHATLNNHTLPQSQQQMTADVYLSPHCNQLPPRVQRYATIHNDHPSFHQRSEQRGLVSTMAGGAFARTTSLFGDHGQDEHEATGHSDSRIDCPHSPEDVNVRANAVAMRSNYDAAKQRKQQEQKNKLNSFHRSHTDPARPCTYLLPRADSTPCPTKSLSQSDAVHKPDFNTPVAVFREVGQREKWEDSVAADEYCIQMLLLKIVNVCPGTVGGISDAASYMPCFQPSPYLGQNPEFVHIPSEMTCLAHATQKCDIYDRSNSKGVSGGYGGVNIFDTDNKRRVSAAHDDLHCDGADHFNALVSSRLSDVHEEAHRLGCISSNNPIQSARQSLLRRVTSSSSSLSTETRALTGRPLFQSVVADRLPSAEKDQASRTKLKLKKSKSKQRRLSMAVTRSSHKALNNSHSLLNHSGVNNMSVLNSSCESHAESAFSPGVKSKNVTSSRSRRRLSAVFAKNSSLSAADNSSVIASPREGAAKQCAGLLEEDEEESERDFSLLDQQLVGESDELVFDGIVLGGSYQHCFEESAPVVSAPSSNEKRITDLQLLSNNALTLSMYLPLEKTTREVELGRNWKWLRASPCGYLVYRDDEPEDTGMFDSCFGEMVVDEDERPKPVCYYYLAKHPEDWMVSSLHKRGKRTNKSLTLLDDPCTMDCEDNHFSSFRSDRTDPYNGEQAKYSSQQRSSFFGQVVGDAPRQLQSMARGLFSSRDTMNMSNCTLNIEESGHCLTQLDVPSIDMDESEEDLLYQEGVVAQVRREKTEIAVRRATSLHCMNSGLMALVFSFLLDAAPVKPVARRGRGSPVPASTSAIDLQSVCKAWALGSFMLAARRMSDFEFGRNASFKYDKWASFVGKFSWGKFLSQGVCKDVYCVQNPVGGLEAVSIMDIADLQDRDMDGVVAQELEISMLCSAMVSLNICPNLVQVHSMFQSEYSVPEALWKSGAPRPSVPSTQQVAVPKKAQMNSSKGSYQFIRMEFCTGGDLEEMVRKAGQLDVCQVRLLMFQMCFALYSCREQVALRHFDIKLLNFFATEGRAVLPVHKRQSRNSTGPVVVEVGFGHHTYQLPLDADRADLVKLADFGTSAVGKECLGDPITVKQFTTVENTPPEYLLLGSAARQCYSADTFPLGLCFLHLLTGSEPYEELLKTVHCPKYLLNRLQKIWITGDESSAFHLVHDVVASLDGEDEEEADEPSVAFVLYDTLYRYAVLFGVSADAQHSSVYGGNPVWSALLDALSPANSKGVKKGSARAECLAQYRRDYETWSVRSGSHPVMVSARQRMDWLGEGATELLDSLTSFDPSKRCSMKEALNSPFFAPLRSHEESSAASSFMHYYRGEESDDAVDDLPIF